MNNDQRNPLLEARGIHKYFGPITALADVNMEVWPGAVHGLLGDNGAGKSTLIQIFYGVLNPDKGELRFEGRPVRFRSPRDAMGLGISVVFQDLAVVNDLSIYRNMFLGREAAVSRKLGLLTVLDVAKAKENARRVLEDVGINVRSVEEPVGSLSGGERQSIAIGRAAHFQSKLLILDEPTSALSLRETAKVLHYIDRARAKGVSVIVISHNIRMIFPVADRFTVLSHGRSVGTFEKGGIDIDGLSALIHA